MTAIYRRRSICCRRCRYAGYTGLAFYDWGTFRLGDVRYKSVEFLTCLRCGVVHACGSPNLRRDECGPWFAQPGILYLSKTKATVWRGDEVTEEWLDCVSKEAEYLLSRAQPDGPPGWHDRGDGLWVADGLPCDRCGPAGELADLILPDGKLLPCPRCERLSLEKMAW